MKDLRRFLALYKQHMGQVTIGILLTLATLGAGIGLLAISGWFIAAMGVAGAAGVTMNYFTPAACIRGLAIIRTAGRYAERLANHDAALKVTENFRSWFYAALEPLAPAGLSDLHSAAIFNRLRHDIDLLEKFYLTGFIPFVCGAISILIIAAAMGFYYPTLAVVEIFLLVITGIMVPLYFTKKSARDHQELSRQNAAIAVSLTDTLQGLSEILIYGGAQLQAGMLTQQASDIDHLQRRLQYRDSLTQAALTLGMGLAVTAGLWIMIPLAGSGDIPAAALAMIPLLCMACFDAVIPLPAALQHFEAAKLAARRIFEIADRRSVTETTHNLISDTGFELKFDDVYFSYGDKPVLEGLNFILQKGAVLTLTGQSGAGKSTVLNLLPGFVRPTRGNITLNGVDIASCDGEDLRKFFAVAPQKPHLFADTLRANLMLAKPDAEVAELDRVCDVAGLKSTIEAMPQGYDTYIGENGVRLSGGQLRRLSIARALLKPAPCLLLDEPGEALDRALELDVMRAVLAHAKARGQAVILCSHEADLAYLGSDAQIIRL